MKLHHNQQSNEDFIGLSRMGGGDDMCAAQERSLSCALVGPVSGGVYAPG